jgi:hypothetical protein
MAPEVDPAQESIVLASFENRHAAEHMLASLGKGFRKEARKGQVSAFVVSVNKDGSLKLTQARVLTGGNLGAALIRVPLAWTVGFIGLFSTLKGGKGFAHAAHLRQAHIGSDEQAAQAILARAGAQGALVLVWCKDADTRRTVTARAAERGIETWEGSRTEFLAALDPGSKHDWVRTALGEPSRPQG